MKKTLLISLCAGVASLTGIASAQTIFWVHEALPYTAAPFFAPAGSTAGITKLAMDDINIPVWCAAQPAIAFEFAYTNGNAVDLSCRPRFRFWNQDGTGVGPTGVSNPGTYIASGAGYSFSPITVAAGGLAYYFTNIAATQLWDPVSGKLWMGQTFDNATSGTGTSAISSTATSSDLNNFGINRGFNASISTSTNVVYLTTAPGSFFLTNNPAGAQQQFATTTTTSDLAFGLGIAGQTVACSLNLQDTTFGAPLTRAMTYVIKNGSNIIQSGYQYNATTSTTAVSFDIPAFINTPCTIEFDGSSFLKKTVTFTPPGVADSLSGIPDFNMVNGDVDASGEVDAVDIDAVIADFGSVYPGGTTPDADVDVSGEVDAVDIDIVIANFGAIDNP